MAVTMLVPLVMFMKDKEGIMKVDLLTQNQKGIGSLFMLKNLRPQVKPGPGKRRSEGKKSRKYIEHLVRTSRQ